MTLNTLLIITVASIGISWLIHKMSGKFPPLAALLLLNVLFSAILFGMPKTSYDETVSDVQVAIWVTVMAYGTFLAKYVKQPPKDGVQLLGLLGLLALVYWCVQILIGGMSLGTVYTSMPLALLLGLLYRVGGMLRAYLRYAYRMLKGGVVDTTHYRSKTITIAYQPGSEMVKLELLPDTIEDEDGNALPVQRQTLTVPLLARREKSSHNTAPLLVANVAAHFKEITNTFQNTSSSTQWVSGSTATGFIGNDLVTVYTPGTAVTTTQPSEGTHKRGTGFGTLRITVTSDGQTRCFSFATSRKVGDAVEKICTLIADQVQAALEQQEVELAAAAEHARLQKQQQHHDDDMARIARIHAAEERAAAAAQQIMREAGLNTLPGEVFVHYSASKDGSVNELIAADRQGRGVMVYDDGASTWIGHWNGAQASCDEFALHVKLVDATYRQQHLKERRASLLSSRGKQAHQEWVDRINILSGTPTL